MDYEKAAGYWLEKDKNSVHMDREALEEELETFIDAHTVCALATADLKGNVRCTPIEYCFLDRKFWMLSEGGLKFRGLEQNKRVSLAIFDSNPDFGTLGGMQVSGTAEIIEPWTEEYLALLKYRHIPEKTMRQLPEPLNLICVTPEEIDYLNSGLKEQGYSSRQHWDRES